MDLIIVLTIIILWIFFLTILYVGWQNLEKYNLSTNKKEKNIDVSILIPFRNEEKNLERLINTLSNQTYPSENTEIILINDHSTDNSIESINNLIKNKSHFKILNLPKNLKGKKQAILIGISHCKNNFIILTDADAYLQPKWIETIVNYFIDKEYPDIIIGPVDYIYTKSLFNKIVRIEFLSLVISGMSLANLKMPIFANSINLAFKKEIFNTNDDILKKSIPSGDDTFLIHYAKKKKKKILPLKSKTALVYTDVPYTFKEFIKQRSRWASKTPYYNDLLSIIIALFVFFVQLIVLYSLTIIFTLKNYLLIVSLIIKTIAEIFFFKKNIRFFNNKFSISIILLAQFFYPIYIIITALCAILIKTKWKDRKM